MAQFVNTHRIQNEILEVATVKLKWHDEETGRGYGSLCH